jgi:hypothetical protein
VSAHDLNVGQDLLGGRKLIRRDLLVKVADRQAKVSLADVSIPSGIAIARPGDMAGLAHWRLRGRITARPLPVRDGPDGHLEDVKEQLGGDAALACRDLVL